MQASLLSVATLEYYWKVTCSQLPVVAHKDRWLLLLRMFPCEQRVFICNTFAKCVCQEKHVTEGFVKKNSIHCPRTSLATNLRLVTSQKSEYLFQKACAHNTVLHEKH